LQLTNSEKIILLLSDFFRYEKEFHVPHEISQKGIAEVIGIRRSNVARELIRLKQRSYVFEKLVHFEGIKRRKKGYFLTDQGLNLASKIRNHVCERNIILKDESGARSEISIDEARKRVGMESSLAEFVARISDDGIYDVKALATDIEIVPGLGESQELSLVGRGSELDVLERILKDVVQGKGKCVLISGEPGVGKTRLVNEFIRNLSKDGAQVLKASCLYQTAIDPYLPFIDALGEHLGKVEKSMADSAFRDIESTAPEIAGLLPLASEKEDTETLALDSGVSVNGERIRLFETISTALKKIAEAKPTVVFIDDLHWADPGSMHLLHYIARNLRESPILLMGAYRPGELVSGNGEDNPILDTISRMREEKLFANIEIGRLSLDETSEMVGNYLKRPGVQGEFADLIFRESEGNPFFIEEILESLQEDRILDGTDERTSIPPRIDIPDSIRNVVRRRVRRLGEGDRKLLELASAMGEKFDLDLAMEASNGGNETMLNSIDKLTEARLICEDTSDVGAFRFHHNKIQDVVYGELNHLKKRMIHERIGAALEATYKDSTQEVLNDLAYHWLKAENFEKAFEYSEKAGARAEKVYAITEALSHYQNALESLEKVVPPRSELYDRRIQLLLKIGDNFELLSKWDDALRNYNMALDASDVEQKSETAFDTLCSIAFVHVRTGELDKAEEVCRRALAQMDKSFKKASRVHEMMGMIFMRQGEYEKSLDRFKEGLEMVDETKDARRIASINSHMATVYSYLNDYDSSMARHEKSLEIHKKSGSRNSLGVSYVNLGMVYWNTGKYEEAIRYAKQALSILEEIGNQVGIGYCYNLIGASYHNTGDYNEALEFFSNSLTIREKIGDRHGIAEANNNIGSIHKNREEYDEAFECFDKCMSILSDMGDQRGCAITNFEIGHTYLQKGDYGKAQAHFEKSMETCDKIGERLFFSLDLCGISECYFRRGEIEKALGHAERAIELSSEIEAKESQIWGRRLHGMIHSHNDEWEKAIEDFESSIEISKETSSEAELGNTFYEFAQMWRKKGDLKRSKKYLELSMKIFTDKKLDKKAERIEGELSEIM
jgi:predicted ATPase/Mn-dependent DtxR family transcriptional regulator